MKIDETDHAPLQTITAATEVVSDAQRAALAALLASDELQKQADAADRAADEARMVARESQKQAKLALRAAEKELRKQTKTANKNRPEQNGVTMPKAGSLREKTWEVFNQIGAQIQAAPTLAQCIDLANASNLQPVNLRTEYAFWRKFYGIAAVKKVKVTAPESIADAPQVTDVDADAGQEE